MEELEDLLMTLLVRLGGRAIACVECVLSRLGEQGAQTKNEAEAIDQSSYQVSRKNWLGQCCQLVRVTSTVLVL